MASGAVGRVGEVAAHGDARGAGCGRRARTPRRSRRPGSSCRWPPRSGRGRSEWKTRASLDRRSRTRRRAPRRRGSRRWRRSWPRRSSRASRRSGSTSHERPPSSVARIAELPVHGVAHGEAAPAAGVEVEAVEERGLVGVAEGLGPGPAAVVGAPDPGGLAVADREHDRGVGVAGLDVAQRELGGARGAHVRPGLAAVGGAPDRAVAAADAAAAGPGRTTVDGVEAAEALVGVDDGLAASDGSRSGAAWAGSEGEQDEGGAERWWRQREDFPRSGMPSTLPRRRGAVQSPRGLRARSRRTASGSRCRAGC